MSTMQSKTLQSGFSNPAIRKYQVNHAIKKHYVFKPHDREILGQPYNQKIPRNLTLQSRRKVRRTQLLGNS